jgi:hypothetical protein
MTDEIKSINNGSLDNINKIIEEISCSIYNDKHHWIKIYNNLISRNQSYLPILYVLIKKLLNIDNKNNFYQFKNRYNIITKDGKDIIKYLQYFCIVFYTCQTIKLKKENIDKFGNEIINVKKYLEKSKEDIEIFIKKLIDSSKDIYLYYFQINSKLKYILYFKENIISEFNLILDQFSESNDQFEIYFFYNSIINLFPYILRKPFVKDFNNIKKFIKKYHEELYKKVKIYINKKIYEEHVPNNKNVNINFNNQHFYYIYLKFIRLFFIIYKMKYHKKILRKNEEFKSLFKILYKNINEIYTRLHTFLVYNKENYQKKTNKIIFESRDLIIQIYDLVKKI